MSDMAKTKAQLIEDLIGLRIRVSELEASLSGLEEQGLAGCGTNYDAVTGLPTRVLLNDRLDVAITQARRYKKNIVVMVVAVSNFKDIVRQVGHRLADRFLRAFAERLKGTLRKADTIGFEGENGFILVLPDIARLQDATEVARKIHDDYRLHVNLSIGIAIYPRDGEEMEALINNAYAAMESSRRIGTNAYYYHNSMRNIDELIGV
jgi:diguanylate cyclase (GGDEF)-like protein